MNRFRRLLKLPLIEKLGVFEAIVLLFLAKLVLAFFPFRWVYAMMKGMTISEGNAAAKACRKVGFVRLSLRRAATHFPLCFPCLAQALVGRIMLFFRGVPSQLMIGVKSADFEAHAWLTAVGEPVTGESVAEGFKVLAHLD